MKYLSFVVKNIMAQVCIIHRMRYNVRIVYLESLGVYNESVNFPSYANANANSVYAISRHLKINDERVGQI
jgi:hypothetical protein